MPDFDDAIDSLVHDASQASDSGDALRFSQAALNVAHAKTVFDENKRAEALRKARSY
jgi:hypothetical protein